MQVLTYMKQISKFMDRDENSGQVQGPLVKFTQEANTACESGRR